MNVLSHEEQDVAENIKRLMEERDPPLSLRQLEELSGVGHSSIHAFLHRGHSPRLQTIFALASALEVDVAEVLKKPARRRVKASA